MITKICDIATVQMGYSFRSRLEPSINGSVVVIQMKDLGEDNIVCCNELIKTQMAITKAHHFAKRGDLVFRSRGLVATSAIILDDIEQAIIAAPLMRIRVLDTSSILPDYLNWYISQKDAQIFFASRAKGTAQKMISKRSIENLEVPLPSLEHQRKIVELAHLFAREQELIDALAHRREQYISTTLMQFAKEQ